MDLLGIVSTVVAPVAEQALRSAFAAKDPAAEVALLPPAISLTVGSDDTGPLLSADQIRELRDYLDHPSIRSLVRHNFVYTLARELDSKLAEDLKLPNLECVFTETAEAWCRERGQHWFDAAPSVWITVTQHHSRFVSGVASKLEPQTSSLLLEHFFSGPVSTPTSVPTHVAVLTRVAEGSIDLHRICAVHDAFYEAFRTDLAEEFDVQGAETTATFESLYIDRSLVDLATGLQSNVRNVLDVHTSSPRAVIIGSPGAGKSTLVNWLRWQFQRDESRGAIPLRIICREDLSNNQSLIAACQSAAEKQFTAPIDAETLEVFLALGLFAIIVDGVDEITDHGKRTTLVAQLERFERRYPNCSIVCTTRRQGFEVQRFMNSPYRVLELHEYDEAQVEEYARRWFSIKKPSIDPVRFIGETRHLLDLRRNPLMLALLCSLYTRHNYIPQSRRDVYMRCAALMFHEWDPKRGIDVPNVFQHRGDSILYQVARFLDRRGGIGATIAERDLLALVTDALTRTGVLAPEANASAREFVQHCSTRAWILSQVRTSEDGEREFAFTHRTFFECFAAEATVLEIVNRFLTGGAPPQPDSLNIHPLTRAIIEPYQRDATSVMPELILQSSQAHMLTISHLVLDDLIKLSRRSTRALTAQYVGLAVRLLAAVGSDDPVARTVMVSLGESWQITWPDPQKAEPLDSFRSLLDVASGHRQIFVTRASNDADVARQFLDRFTVIAMLGEMHMYDPEWVTLAKELLVSLGAGNAGHVWLAARLGIMDYAEAIAATDSVDLVEITVLGHRGSGVFWEWLRRSESHEGLATAASRVLSELRRWESASSRLTRLDDDQWQGRRFIPTYVQEIELAENESLPSELCLWIIVHSTSDVHDADILQLCGEPALKELVLELRRMLDVLINPKSKRSHRDKVRKADWPRFRRTYRAALHATVPRWLSGMILAEE